MKRIIFYICFTVSCCASSGMEDTQPDKAGIRASAVLFLTPGIERKEVLSTMGPPTFSVERKEDWFRLGDKECRFLRKPNGFLFVRVVYKLAASKAKDSIIEVQLLESAILSKTPDAVKKIYELDNQK